jgi:hypothetical protein
LIVRKSFSQGAARRNEAGRMTQEQLETLKNSEKQIDTITCLDGDVLQGTIPHVDEEYRDAVCELVSTNRPEKYNKGTCYAIAWDDIVDLQREDPE